MFDFAINSQAKAFLVGVQEAVPMLRDGGRIIAMTYAPAAASAVGSRGWPWARPKRRWKSCAVTSPWRWLRAKSR